MYVIDVAPRTHRVLQDMDELTSIDEINRILHDVDESFEEEGLSTQEEINYYNSTSTSGSSSSDFGAQNVLLENRMLMLFHILQYNWSTPRSYFGNRP